MAREDAVVPAAVAAARDEIAEVVDALADRLRRGGRLVYVGAGTSGRIAALDASECETTFGVPVVAVTADTEAGEDDAESGAARVHELAVGGLDAVVGVSASGA